MGKKSVTFSFDDGNLQDVPFVELLNKYGMQCTFNLNSGLMSESRTWMYKDLKVVHLNATDIGDLYRGHEIAAHSLTHPWLEKLNEKTIYNEIYRDKCNLEDWFGEEVVGLAYPFGTYDDRVVEIAKQCGIKYARTIENTPLFTPQKDLMRFKATCSFRNPEVFSLIDRFLESESDEKQVLYIWGHTYELDGDNAWGHMEEICKKLTSAKGLVFETNKDALLKD